MRGEGVGDAVGPAGPEPGSGGAWAAVSRASRRCEEGGRLLFACGASRVCLAPSTSRSSCQVTAPAMAKSNPTATMPRTVLHPPGPLFHPYPTSVLNAGIRDATVHALFADGKMMSGLGDAAVADTADRLQLSRLLRRRRVRMR